MSDISPKSMSIQLVGHYIRAVPFIPGNCPVHNRPTAGSGRLQSEAVVQAQIVTPSKYIKGIVELLSSSTGAEAWYHRRFLIQ